MRSLTLRLELHRGRRPVCTARYRRGYGDGLFSIAWTLWLWSFNSEGEIGWWST